MNIPLIIEASKQQKIQIEILQKIVYSQEQELINLKIKFKDCCPKDKVKPTGASTYEEPQVENAQLFDNVPNPFSSNTEIKFKIPEKANAGRLIIHDMQGVELLSFNIRQKGFGSITINGSELRAGMYLYTLLVDNEIINTKRMLLTKD